MRQLEQIPGLHSLYSQLSAQWHLAGMDSFIFVQLYVHYSCDKPPTLPSLSCSVTFDYPSYSCKYISSWGFPLLRLRRSYVQMMPNLGHRVRKSIDFAEDSERNSKGNIKNVGLDAPHKLLLARCFWLCKAQPGKISSQPHLHQDS